MFENVSKFCQNLKFLITVFISEIPDFDHFLNILKSKWILTLKIVFWRFI